MAVNANILLQGRSADVGNALLQGVGVGEGFERIRASKQQREREKELRPLEARLAELRADQAEQGLDIGDQNLILGDQEIASNDLARQQQLAKILTPFYEDLMSVENVDERRQRNDAMNQALKDAGFTPDDEPDDLSFQGLANSIESMRPFTKGLEGLKPVGVPFLVKEGNRHFTAQQMVDENGAISITKTEIPGALVDRQGQDTASRIYETGAKAEVTQAAQTGGFKARQDVKLETEPKITRAVEEEKADVDVEKEIRKLTGRARETRIDAVIDSGIAAADVVPSYNRMLELVDLVSTGRTQAAIQSAKQLFGKEDVDLGELDILFKEAVLSNIKKMGSNPTEGERQFLLESSGSISQNKSLIKRIITTRLRGAEKSVGTARKFAEKREDTDAIEIIDAALVPTASLPPGVTEEDIKFTMQKHGITREEVMGRLR